MFYTWGCLDTPYVCMPHTCVCPLYICMPANGVTHPTCPPYSVHLYVLMGCMLWGLEGAPLHVGHLPLSEDASP